MTIAAVTPWLAHHELAPDYLAALEAGPWPDEVIIVDNGEAPVFSDCTVLEPGTNLGFSQGSNLGLQEATSDAVLFLNNDIALQRAGWLDEIRQALEPGVLVGQLRFDAHADVDGNKLPYLDGWCLAGMREDLLELGGFADSLEEPAYYSDNILCLEARAAGMTLREVTVGLHHKKSTTSRPASNPQVQRASMANRERYVARVRELLAPA